MTMQRRALLWGAIVGAGLIGTGCADEGATAPIAPVEAGGVAAGFASARSTLTQFFVPPPDTAAARQIAGLIRSRDFGDARKLAAMEATPRAVWFESGTPHEVERSVRQTMERAASEGRVPILVAYDIPFRDCAQYSSGGAADTASYEAWIAGFARGIGRRKAVVILEPDSLGIIPYNTTTAGFAEWCKPTVVDATGATVPAPGASSDERYAQLQGAIATLAAAAPGASVYLDGTHSDWLGVGEAAFRIHKAGFDPTSGAPLVKGFFLNVSNFQPTDQLIQFGTWVSQCLAAGTAGVSWAIGHFEYCPSQYDPATNYTAVNYTPAFEATVTAGLESMLNGAAATLPFVIDTGRNGRGPLDATTFAAAPYDQPASVIKSLTAGAWCNPPGAGAGLRPTATTGVPLLDAYLWIKTPGGSDGACAVSGGARAWDYSAYDPWNVSGDAQNTFDLLWGMVDPDAGAWFPAQALQLAKLAVPPLP
ncbi:MAG: glycoside hydrolase family 6 protein [Pseudomonadota bacterium]